MELDPTRTAVIAVHLQKDIVNADGAFGGFFAAQAVERDVVGVNSHAAGRRPPRRLDRRLHPRRLATRPGRPHRQLPHPADRPTVRLPGRGQRQGADPGRAHPAGRRPGRHPPTGRRVLRQPTGPPAPQPRHRHPPVHRSRHQLLRRRHRPASLRPRLPHHHRRRRLQRRRPRHPRRLHRLPRPARRDHHQRRGSRSTVGDRQGAGECMMPRLTPACALDGP